MFNQFVYRHCNINIIRFINKGTINFCRTFGAQFLNTTCVAALSGCFCWRLPPATAAAIVLVTVIFPATKIYALRIITKTWFYWFFKKFYWIRVRIITFWFTVNNIPFFVANFEFSLSEPFSKFTVFCVSIICMTVTKFCEKLKVVSSDFSMIKNIVAPWSWFSSFPTKLICCGLLI